MSNNDTIWRPFLKRIDNPILITFISVFVIYNWKFFYYLLIPFKIPNEGARLDVALMVLNGNVITLTRHAYEVPSYLWYPICFTLLSLIILPLLNHLYNYFLLSVTVSDDFLKKKQDLKLKRRIFKTTSETLQLDEKIKNVEAQISELRKTVLQLKSNATTDVETEFQYNLLKPGEKHSIAKAVYALKDVLFFQKNFTPRKARQVELIEVIGNDVKLTKEAAVFLEKFSTEFPGKLES